MSNIPLFLTPKTDTDKLLLAIARELEALQMELGRQNAGLVNLTAAVQRIR